MSECARAKNWLALPVSDAGNEALVALLIVQVAQCGDVSFKSFIVSLSLVASFLCASAQIES